MGVNLGDRTSFRNTSLPIDSVMLFKSSQRPGWWKLKVSIASPDRDSGAAGYYGVVDWFKPRKGFRPTRKWIAEKVRDALFRMLKHEVDEALHVDGKRVNDPHRKRRRR